MYKLLPNLKFALLFTAFGISILGCPYNAVSQSNCTGASPGSITGGGTSVVSPGYVGGYLCANTDLVKGAANDPLAGALIEISAGNVQAGKSVLFIVNWGDGTGDQISPIPTGPNSWKVTVNEDSRLRHFYPLTGSNVSCQYSPNIRLIIDGETCSTSFGNIPPFTRWNIDTENDGKLELSPTLTPGTDTYYVCKGDLPKDITFTDRSTLNCTGSTTLNVNDDQRWRRFTYGELNTMTGSVLLNSASATFPYIQSIDSEPQPVLSPLSSTVTSPITIPASALANEEFQIKMEYWNYCNPYPAGTPAVKIAKIIVVDQPTAPTPQDAVQCSALTSADKFSITGVPPGSIVTWNYNDASGPVDAPGVGVIQSSVSTSLLFTNAFPSPALLTTPGVYKVWASYRETTGNGCESVKVPVTITLLTPTVTATAGPDQSVCDNMTSLSLDDTSPTVEVGQWTVQSQPPLSNVTFSSNDTDQKAKATVDAIGVYVFRWSVSDASCTVYDDVKVIYDRKPSAPSPSSFSKEICDPSITLVATAPDKQGTGEWSSLSPVNINPTSASTTLVSGLLPGPAVIITWTVKSQFEGCPEQTADYTIKRNPIPSVTNSVPALCEDAEGSGQSTLLVSSNDATVTQGIPNRVVTWFTDVNRSISAPSSLIVHSNDKLYFTVTDLITNCPKNNDVTFTVHALPLAIDQNADYCEAVKGSNQSPSVDLITDFNSRISSAATFVWKDNGTGNTLTAGEASAYSYVNSASLSVHVQSSATGCFNDASVSLGITTRPEINPILLSDGKVAASPLSFCLGDDIVVLHADPTINPGSTFEWSIPTEFQSEVIGGGTPNFYVLLKFQNAQSLPGLPMMVREIKTGGCDGDWSSPVNITVDAPSDSGPTISGDEQACKNEQGKSYSVNNPDPSLKYQWQVPSDAFIIGDNTGSNIKVNWGATSGNVIAQEKSAGGCISPASNPIMVQVYDRPVVDFTIDGSTSKCSGEEFSFHTAVDPNVTYTWSWGDGQTTTSTSQLEKHTFLNPALSTIYNYEVKLSAIYTGSTVCEAEPVSKTMYVKPAVQPAISAEKVKLCSGEEIQINNQSIGTTSSQWFVDNVEQPITRGTDPFTYRFINTTNANPSLVTVKYIGTNPYDCPGESEIVFQVYKNVQPDFDFAITKLFSEFATVDYTNTSATSNLSDPDIQYNWTFGEANDARPGTYIGGNPTISVNYSSPGTKYITLTTTNVDNALCNSSVTKPVLIVRPELAGDFKVTPKFVCLPADVIVHNNILGGDSFEWTLFDANNVEIAKASGLEPTFKIANAGVYDIQPKVMLNGAPHYFDRKNVTVYEIPIAAFVASPAIVTVPDIAIHINNQTIGANTYLWDFGDNTTSTDKQPVHAYLNAGDYIITLVASNDHGDLDVNDDGQLVHVTCSNVPTSQEVKAIDGGSYLLPNAFSPNTSGPGSASVGDTRSNDIFLPITKGVEKFEMLVYDRWGSLVFLSKDKNVGWDGYDHHGNLMPAGVYLYKLSLTFSDGQHTTQAGDVTLLR